jgi:diketogulonate reductase-like aldo/keto reductase
MQYRSLASTGVEIATVGAGTWNMERDRDDDVVAAIRLSVELGMTHVDTAELYGRGAVETTLGRALAGIRDRVFLVSKVMPSHASRTGTIAACERSLARLGTDRLDLYLLHWPGRFALEETVAGMRDLVAAGKILRWGVSNFDVDDLARLAAVTDPGEVVCNQVLYHLEQRAIEHRVMPWCLDHGVAIVGYSPLGSGTFVDPTSSGGRVLSQIAAEVAATPQQVALAWLTRRSGTFTIPKATSLAHVRSNAAAGDLRLTPAQCDTIDRAFPVGDDPRLPTL